MNELVFLLYRRLVMQDLVTVMNRRGFCRRERAVRW